MKIARVRGSKLRADAVLIHGFKHSTVLLMAASVACGRAELRNVPEIDDVRYLSDIIRTLGGKTSLERDLLTIESDSLSSPMIPEELGGKIHGVLYLIPVLLGRLGRVQFGDPGGCLIGPRQQGGRRPLQHLLSVLERFGAEFALKETLYEGRCRRFHPCQIDILDYSDLPQVLSGSMVSGATKVALLASALTNGTTVIRHPSLKPDVRELIDFLRLTGCIVEELPERLAVTPPLHLSAASFEVSPDINEIMTYIACSLYLECPLRLNRTATERLHNAGHAEWDSLKKLGLVLSSGPDQIDVPNQGTVQGTEMDVVWDGIYSDSHPFFTLILLRGETPSLIREFVWRERFQYAEQLKLLGARLKIEGNRLAIFPGRADRPGRTVSAGDLRAAAVLLIAALGIQGETIIEGVEQLSRGYPDFIGSLTRLGADIEVQEVKIAS